MSTVTLLDVGHGNCAIVRDGKETAVIDCPTGSILIDTLEDMGVSTVGTAIISHADKDHIAGILALLTSDRIQVKRVYVNPDGQKSTKVWKDFRVAARFAELNGGCEFITSLSSTTPGKIDVGEVAINVVAPSSALALTGVGGTSIDGQNVTANTLSGVLRIDKGKCDGVLLAGDMDAISLEDTLKLGTDLSANVLVFPHHGGLPGNGDVEEFTDKLLNVVKPRLVVFSNGRGRHDNPRPEIVRGALRGGCEVACTQLSKRCHDQPANSDAHLETLRAHGRYIGASCAGSITLSLDRGAIRDPAANAGHSAFIAQVVSPMCRSRTN